MRLKNHWQIILYGIALAGLIFMLKWLETMYLFNNQEIEVYIGMVAVIFMGLGIWLTLQLKKPKAEIIYTANALQQASATSINADVPVFNLSKRELDVLILMADGLSNQEIAERLFVSLNTVKTHSAQIFSKLDVKRRTQAVNTAKKLGILG